MKRLIIIAILLALTLSGCSIKRYIKPPCKYPTIKKIDRPHKKEIKGFKSCMALVGDKWVKIGACIDYRNTLILKAQNRKQERVILGYERKLDNYSDKYLDVNQSKGVNNGKL